MKTKKIKLKNGLRVIFAPQKESVATTVAVIVEAGSKYETKKMNGLSHFLEHMCFKGTEKRPKAIDITSELDSLGAEYNAFTSHEYTSYFAKAKNSSAHEILDIVSDMYINPVFNNDEIKKERGVIIEEINMYEDIPMRKVQELIMELVYGNQPAGWSIAGTKENIKSMERNDFIKYRSRNYLPKSTIVSVSGNFNEKKMLRDIENNFNSLKNGKKQKKIKTKDSQNKPAVKIHVKQSDQTHLVLALRAFDVFNKKKHALQILSDVLGGSMSSRLFQKIRDELGAAYYIKSETDLYSDHGLFMVSAGVDNKKLEIVVKAIMSELKNIRDNGITKNELMRSKEHLIGRLLLSLETSDELAYFYGIQEVLGLKLRSPEEAVSSLNKISISEVNLVACEIIKNKNLNLALIGPFQEKKFGDIVKL